ncbi:MAG TPA: UDP-N-acetylglucosamine 2-epimerase [Bacteroidia bacterium]|nr:UDP-N-acetylglucosamine 2-epimerase [Bacteroidia bacterium]HRH09421.1 UDP-N-acetylglucosamine 2-epimerase [Bacteroidia bacterium]
MTIGIITTSRADFGIYLPLLKALKNDGTFRLLLFAGGMHTSEMYGNSYQLIEAQGFKINEKLYSLSPGDDAESIAKAMGTTTHVFASIWKKYASKIDVLFVLGDRFEMFAAASSVIPFGIPLAHIHGGETTLGAIDNKFRHALSCLSNFHFTTNEEHKNRVAKITGSNENVFNVGALGIDSIMNMKLFTPLEFKKSFQFSVDEPYILCTYHPETMHVGANKTNVVELIKAFMKQPMKVLCTLPNADTDGQIIRKKLLEFEKKYPQKITCFENLGQKGYLTAMKYCSIMVGNTSSGIIESAALGIPVVNVGNRQQGRLSSNNVVHVSNEHGAILKGITFALKLKGKKFKEVYGNGAAAKQIIAQLKKIKTRK